MKSTQKKRTSALWQGAQGILCNTRNVLFQELTLVKFIELCIIEESTLGILP
jgi:hypothetical protein